MAVFMLIGKTSALTMNVAGVVKDWLLILLSVVIYGCVLCCARWNLNKLVHGIQEVYQCRLGVHATCSPLLDLKPFLALTSLPLFSHMEECTQCWKGSGMRVAVKPLCSGLRSGRFGPQCRQIWVCVRPSHAPHERSTTCPSFSAACRSPVTKTQLGGYGLAFCGVCYYNYKWVWHAGPSYCISGAMRKHIVWHFIESKCALA